MNLPHRIRSAALALGILAAFSMPAATLADPGQANTAPDAPKSQPGCPIKRGNHHRCDIMKQLNLTEQQREQLKAMHEKFKDTHQGDCGKMQARWQEMKQLRQDPEANKDKIAAMKAQMKLTGEAHFAERKAALQKILTPEQFSQFESLRQQCKAQQSNGQGRGKRHGQKRQAPADTGSSAM